MVYTYQVDLRCACWIYTSTIGRNGHRRDWRDLVLGEYGYGGWRDIQGKLREEHYHVDVHVLIDITLTRKDL